MADDVSLNFNITGGGDDGSTPDQLPVDPFAGIEPLTKDDLIDIFPPKGDMSAAFDVLKSAAFKDFLDAKNTGKTLDEIFKDLPSLSKATEFDSSFVGMLPEDFEDQLDSFFKAMSEGNEDFAKLSKTFKDLDTTVQAFDSSIVGFFPEDFEEGLDNFFKALQEDTDAIEAQKKAFDKLLEDQNDAFQALANEINSVIQPIIEWTGTIGRSIAVVSGLIVTASLANAVLKEFVDSLGEYAMTLRAEQAETSRSLMLQSLRNSSRLDEQLASVESDRAELARQLEQFKVELFDLFHPIIRFLTQTLGTILEIINLILAALNFIKDLLDPTGLIRAIYNLLVPVSEKAKRDLRKNDIDKAAPGLGTIDQLFDLDNLNVDPKDLPAGLQDDVVEHPFEFPISEGKDGGLRWGAK